MKPVSSVRGGKIAFLIVAVSLTGGALFAEGVPQRAEDVCPIMVGEALPEIELLDVNGEAFDLNAAVAAKPTVLIFYRGGWCPYCNLHLAQLQEAEKAIVEMGYQILAISPDRPAKLREPAEKNKLAYTLLSDADMAASKALGIAFQVSDATLERYEKKGIDLEGDSGYDHNLLPVPAAFVLGTTGLIEFSYVNANYKVRVNPEVLITAARVVLEKE